MLFVLSLRPTASSDGIVVERNPGPPPVTKVHTFKVQGGTDFNMDRTYFVAPNGNGFDVRRLWIVAIIEFPDLSEIQQIKTEADLHSLLVKKSRLEETVAKVPQARPYVSKPLDALNADIARFRSGQRMIDGQWFTPAQLAAAEAERRALEEKRIAEQKAAEERRLAEQKAEEEKRAAEEKAEDEKRAAEEKAEDERRILEEKAAEEKRHAEIARLTAEFKGELKNVFPDVARFVSSFHQVSNFQQIKQLPNPVSERVAILTTHAQHLREQLGSGVSLYDGREELVMADALQVVNDICRAIAAADAAVASSKVSAFLKANPEPISDNQKAVWTYLGSVHTLCSREERDANIHIERGQSFFSAGKSSDAIREYQEAYRRFPNPQTATKIKEIQDRTLGL